MIGTISQGQHHGLAPRSLSPYSSSLSLHIYEHDLRISAGPYDLYTRSTESSAVFIPSYLKFQEPTLRSHSPSAIHRAHDRPVGAQLGRATSTSRTGHM